MVTLTKNELVITIPSASGSSAENWLTLHRQLAFLISNNLDNDFTEQPWMVMELMSNLTPDEETAQKLIS